MVSARGGSAPSADREDARTAGGATDGPDGTAPVDSRHELKRLSKDTLWYGGAAAVQKFIVFLLFPIYTRLLTQADFGAQDLVATFVMVTSLFLVMGMDSGAVIHYYEVPAIEQEKIRSTWLWSQVLLSVPVCGLLLLLAPAICGLVFRRTELAPYLRLGVAAIPFSQMVRAISLVLRLTFRTRAFVFLTTAGVVLQVAAAIVLVVVLRKGISGVFLAILIAAVLQMCLAFVLVRGVLRPGVSASWFMAMLKLGIPLVPAALSLWVMNYANRYVLVRYATLADIGVLSVALRISSILLFAISSFETAWGPAAFSMAKDRESARKIYGKVLTYFLAVVIPGTAALSIFAREITSVLAGPAYASGAALVPLYCFSSIFWVLLFIVGMGASIAKKTYHSSIAIVTAACVNMALNFALIPSHGIVGAAVATVAANLVALVYMYFIGQHYFRVPYDARSVVVLFSLAAVAIVPAVVADQVVLPWNAAVLCVKAGLVMVPLLGVFVFRIVSPTVVLETARGVRRAAVLIFRPSHQ